MSGEGRTVWQAQDAAWWRRERVVLLGEQFGSEGPALANWLECEAKAQNAGGKVKAGYATCARGAFITSGAGRAREIVAFAAELGFLKEFVEGDRTFTATIAAFESDQRHALAAARQQRARERSVTERDGASPSVTGRDQASPTGQERTEGLEEDSSLRSSSSLPPPGDEQERPEQEGRVITFDRKPVPPERLQLAETILAEFNRQAGTRFGAYTGRGRPSEDLRRILGALADADPPLTLDEAARMIARRLERPFWDGKPHTGVVFGPKVLAANREEGGRTAANGSVPSRELAARFNQSQGVV